jgi:hypothetical protein
LPSVTPKPVKTSEKAENMLRFNLENEKETIRQADPQRVCNRRQRSRHSGGRENFLFLKVMATSTRGPNFRLRSLLHPENSLIFECLSLLPNAGKSTKSACSTAFRRSRHVSRIPKSTKFPVKFPVCREFV